MSNHSASYLLNSVFKKLDNHGVFEQLGREKTQHLVVEILRDADRIDCNPGEILEDLEERLGVCSSCRKPADDFVDGLCPECQERYL